MVSRKQEDNRSPIDHLKITKGKKPKKVKRKAVRKIVASFQISRKSAKGLFSFAEEFFNTQLEGMNHCEFVLSETG